MIVTAEGIVLRTLRYGDTSTILTVFTREHGKVTLMAKGARSKTSSFGASLEVMSQSQFVFYHKAGRDIQLLSKADLLRRSNRILESGERIFYGFAMLELLDGTAQREERNDSLYDLALKGLELLDQIDLPPGIIFLHFLINLITELGFYLDLDACLICREEWRPETRETMLTYLPQEGGFLCPSCATARIGRNIQARMPVLLSRLRTAPECPMDPAPLPAESREAQELLLRYLRLHLPELRELKSLSMIGLFS